MPWNFDMYIRNRVDTSPSPVPWATMCKQLFGFIGFMLFMFYLGEEFKSYQPVVSTDQCSDLIFCKSTIVLWNDLISSGIVLKSRCFFTLAHRSGSSWRTFSLSMVFTHIQKLNTATTKQLQIMFFFPLLDQNLCFMSFLINCQSNSCWNWNFTMNCEVYTIAVAF